MKIDSIAAYNNEVYRHTQIKHTDQMHSQRVQEDRRLKQIHETDEAKRIEMNRRMNRPGQNVDKMA
jgi:hypothetical protein